MAAESARSGFAAASSRERTPESNDSNTTNLSSSSINNEFDESQCLFCNQTSGDVEQNLVHMSKSHGLHVDREHLLVDVGTLLAYFHLVISGYYECLYCGTQRNTHQAAQQHMMAKGHCKYNISDDDAELREFYELSSSDEKEEMHRNLSARRSSNGPQLPSQTRSRKARPSRHSDKHDSKITASPLDQAPPTTTPQSAANVESNSRSLGELSTRAQKQEYSLNNQLAQLRAEDRRSLLHLPASQQRAILATHHKQMEKARRTEQTYHGNLAAAGNKTNCLDKIRLIRKPPHTGNVFSLNR